jgi:DNA polymerase I
MDTIYLIDGHSQMFRAYHALSPGSMTAPNGEPTWASYVFMNMLLKFFQDHRPSHVAMAIDGPREKLKRTAIYPEYKQTRKPTPEDFFPQEKRIIEMVDALGIPILNVPGYEADDILATLAERFGGAWNVVLVSRDKDLDQLVTDTVRLYDPMKDETLDAETILASKGYRPDQALDVQALIGDTSDNVPGVPGVGPKTAVKLINTYGSLEEVLAHADEQTPKLSENLTAHHDTALLARTLIALDRDVPIDITPDELCSDRLQWENLQPIFAEVGFDSLARQVEKITGQPLPAGNAPTQAAAPAAQAPAEIDYQVIDTPGALAALVDDLAGVTRLAVDTETTSVHPMFATLVGISLSWRPGQGVYLPLRAPLGEATLDLDAVAEALGPVLTDTAIEKIAHNLKYDLIVLRRAGLELAGPYFDTMVAAWVLDSTRRSYKLDVLAEEMLAHTCIPIEDVIGKGRNATTMDNVPTDVVGPYAAEDADIALRLADHLAPQLDREKLQDLLAGLEMELLPVLADMEQTGIRVDPQRLKAMETELSNQADTLREDIVTAAGSAQFNPDSPKQLGEILFGKFQLPVVRKTKTGPSTDSAVLEQLAAEHNNPIPTMILEYRKLTKLLSTYLKALAECIHPQTGRVHTSFHQASTATGRLSSSDPNLQNIPIRTEQGRQIRSAFVAEEGWELLSADYSQVELRMLAHFCRDETLLAAFADDQDIHRTVAAEVFGLAVEDVTPEQRDRAKGVNFGIIYGQTAFGLARALSIPRHEAEDFITRYKKRFPRIDEFLQECIARAQADGYVETILGRRRTIPDIGASNAQVRAQAERLAINSVVQGSAADLIKQAMVHVARRIAKQDRPERMLLQIHDELVLEVPAGDESAEAMLVEEMTGAIELAVPLKVDVGRGPSWLEAK